MASRVFRFVGGNSTNLNLVQQIGANITGVEVANPIASAIYLKFYLGANAPTVGTTVPYLTVTCIASGATSKTFPVPISAPQTLWVATTLNLADSDATAIGAGGPVVQVLVE
jgi:hypothetical protein